MFSISTLILTAAFAAPPANLTADALVAANTDASLLIAKCESNGQACGATKYQLAEAFVVRAVAASVLRGELDARAVANARHLDPNATKGWEALLPSVLDDQPLAWVAAYKEPLPASVTPSATLPPLSPTSTAKSPTPSAVPLKQRGALALKTTDDALQVRVQAAAAMPTYGPGSLYSGGIGAQIPASQFTSLWTEIGGASSTTSTPYFYDANNPTAGANDVTMQVRELLLSFGAGPRWTAPGGAELHLIAGVQGTVESLGNESRDVFIERGASPSNRASRVGPLLGVVGVAPFKSNGAVAFRWEGWASMGVGNNIIDREFEWWMIDNPPMVDPTSPPYEAPRNNARVHLLARPSISYQPNRVGFGASAGFVVQTNRPVVGSGRRILAGPLGVQANLLYTR